MYQIARKYPFSTATTLLIWIVCLIPISETPLTDISFGDKWAHVLMYLLLSVVIAFEFSYRNKKLRLGRFLIATLAFPILTGGLIELAQAYLTFGMRSGEWLDWVADCLGATVSSLICTPLAMYRAKARKDE